jgi:hypothetical protein
MNVSIKGNTQDTLNNDSFLLNTIIALITSGINIEQYGI